MDDSIEQARTAGRKLALDLTRTLTPAPSTSMRLATITRINLTQGAYTADLALAGATLHAIPITTDCLGCSPGDRVIVETYGTRSYVTGRLARTSTVEPLFEWSSTWSGDPSNEPSAGYVEKTQKITVGGPILCEVAAAIGGTGEYCLAFAFADESGKQAAYWCATSPQKNGGTLRWTSTGTIHLAPGTYTATLTSYHWGTVTIIGNDSSGNSRRWRDSRLGTDGVPRYARLQPL